MGFEPQKFFIGLVDFFSVLLPGAFAVYVGNWAAEELGRSSFDFEGADEIAVFLFASYLVGHFVFLIGAAFLDPLYDQIRNARPYDQVKRLAQGRRRSFWLWRVLASSRLIFGKEPDKAIGVVLKLKVHAFKSEDAEDSIKAFQWCKARLSKENPEGLAIVNRFEADSKFFRSFIVVLTPLLGFLIYQRRGWLILIVVLLLLASLWRYMEQRFKSTQHAYWHVITLDNAEEVVTRPSPPSDLTHAGGVVWRRNGQKIEYLLVTARRVPGLWVLPKGHIDPGETAEEAAVREVHEETGCWARISKPLDAIYTGPRPAPVKRGAKKPTPNTAFYLMELASPKRAAGPQGGEGRTREWKTLDDAIKALRWDDSKRLLEQAEEAILSARTTG